MHLPAGAIMVAGAAWVSFRWGAKLGYNLQLNFLQEPDDSFG